MHPPQVPHTAVLTAILLPAGQFFLVPLCAVLSFPSSLAFLSLLPNLPLAFEEPSGPTALLAALCSPYQARPRSLSARLLEGCESSFLPRVSGPVGGPWKPHLAFCGRQTCPAGNSCQRELIREALAPAESGGRGGSPSLLRATPNPGAPLADIARQP